MFIYYIFVMLPLIAASVAEVEYEELGSEYILLNTERYTDDILGYMGGCIEGTQSEHEFDSQAYYICIQGEQILMRCEDNEHFNIERQDCINESITSHEDDLEGSGNYELEYPLVDLNETWSNECPKNVFIILLPHPKHCRLYYKCISGHRFIKYCVYGYFSYTKQACVDARFADCIFRN